MRVACEAHDFAGAIELDIEFDQSIVERTEHAVILTMFQTGNLKQSLQTLECSIT